MKKFATAVIAAIAFSAAPAFAQAPAAAQVDPKAAAAVQDLLAAMHYRQLISDAFEQVSRNTPQMVLQMGTARIKADPKLTEAERKAELDKVAQRIPEAVSSMKALLGDPKLVDDMIAEVVPLYARHFTVAEIKEITAFYKTPIGTKMLTEMPLIMGEAMQISNRVMMPRVQKLLEKSATTPPAK